MQQVWQDDYSGKEGYLHAGFWIGWDKVSLAQLEKTWDLLSSGDTHLKPVWVQVLPLPSFRQPS